MLASLCGLDFAYVYMYTSACIAMYVCQYVGDTDRSTVYVFLLDTFCVSVCVDVGCMYYAVDLAERGAINKTGLQCARWQNNLSDSMEKEREDKAKCAGRERKRQGECKTDEVEEK